MRSMYYPKCVLDEEIILNSPNNLLKVNDGSAIVLTIVPCIILLQPKLRKDFFLFLFWSIQVQIDTLGLDHAGKLNRK